MHIRLSNRRGITLVALVITIIILLILAGITIQSITNQGLFVKAQETKEKMENAQKQESEMIENYLSQINAIVFKNVDKTQTNPEAAMPYGTTVVEGDANKGIVIKDSKGNEWVWVEVPKKTVFTTATKVDDYENIENDLFEYAKDYRAGKAVDKWYGVDGNNFVTADTEGLSDAQKLLNNGCGLTYYEYDNIYKKMLSSVYENGGFWISRYEIGDSTSTESNLRRTKDSGTSGVAVSKVNQIPYTWVTCSEAQNLASKMISDSNKVSSLLFGIQWDLTCKFLEVKSDLTKEDIKSDSTSWGNYKNNSLILHRGKYYVTEAWKNYNEDTPNNVVASKTLSDEKYSQLLTTGASDETNKMGIYDFAGNVWEITLEKYNSTNLYFVIRGSCFLDSGNIGNAFRNSIYSINGNGAYNIGFRVSIY